MRLNTQRYDHATVVGELGREEDAGELYIRPIRYDQFASNPGFQF